MSERITISLFEPTQAHKALMHAFDPARFFAAMWLSEGWHERWLIFRRPHYRARAAVVFDRMMAGEIDRHERYQDAALADLQAKETSHG